MISCDNLYRQTRPPGDTLLGVSENYSPFRYTGAKEPLTYHYRHDFSLTLVHRELAQDNEELLTPKYLLCPALFSIAHLKKFIIFKYGISERHFCVEIMYKVKTIILPDYYTLMDVAYIYTWKRVSQTSLVERYTVLRGFLGAELSCRETLFWGASRISATALLTVSNRLGFGPSSLPRLYPGRMPR